MLALPITGISDVPRLSFCCCALSYAVQCSGESTTSDAYTTPDAKRYAKAIPLAAFFAFVWSAGVPTFFYFLVVRFKELGKAGDIVVQSSLGWMCTLFHLKQFPHYCRSDRVPYR